MEKIKVGILCGGKSAEHEVSLQSAKNVIEALNKERFEAVLIGIDKAGRWHLSDASSFLLNAEDPATVRLDDSGPIVCLLPGDTRGELFYIETYETAGNVDVVFPVLHGPLGEDGSVQGLLRLTDIPFVGAGVLGSAVGMDKDVMKRLLRDAGIPIAKFLTYTDGDLLEISYQSVVEILGLPCFVKPANMGSSVGVAKVKNEASFDAAVRTALEYDTKILIEEAIEGMEVECSVLGNNSPIASVVGKIIPQAEFYSYEAKYIDEHGAVLEIPANLPPDVAVEVQRLSILAFKALSCEGMARVDMFVTPEGKPVLNEINTIPGFTKISMYPKLWGVTGLAYTELITRLIELALERHERQAKLKTSYG